MRELDPILDDLSKLVTEHGPGYLIRGMTNHEASDAILQCVEKLVKIKEAARRLLTVSSMSELEPRVKELAELFGETSAQN